MTQDEIEIFKNEIKRTIIPHVVNLPNEKIKEIMNDVVNSNPSIPKSFGNMLYEQIIIAKQNSVV